MAATNRVNRDNSVELTANFDLGKKKSPKPLRLRANLITEKGPTVIKLDKITNLTNGEDLQKIGPASGDLQLKLRFTGLQVNPLRAGLRVWLERDREEGGEQ
jgi:hypothetical protein